MIGSKRGNSHAVEEMDWMMEKLPLVGILKTSLTHRDQAGRKEYIKRFRISTKMKCSCCTASSGQLDLWWKRLEQRRLGSGRGKREDEDIIVSSMER